MNSNRITRSAAIGLAVAGVLGASGVSHAAELVSTIYGVYDANSCGTGPSCLSAPAGQPLATNLVTSGGTSYDTPTLFINNNTAYSFSNVQITLSAYQGLNNGSMTTIPSSAVGGGTIGANTLYGIVWTGGSYGNPVPSGGTNTSADLFSYDYDDYYSGNNGAAACTGPGGQGTGFCERPGNFDVTFSATWNNPAFGAGGTPISAVFSPDNTQGNGNAAGTFVGWQGLDPTGLAETAYDNHTGSVAGVLADIYVGTPNQITSVPEPASMGLLAAGLGAIGMARRRRKAP
jgi:hypothetical protein